MSDADALRAGAPVRVARGPKNRQRQRLIDACISALHIHGPSRTTVEKVVALANLSPGIVRFYFKSKAAMLVASLQFLATEFEEKVLVPVTEMRDTPVEAMRRLVDLYLDPELASPRKISVWYAFWGEATARQEYYEICGQKDDSFVALVRELMRRLVARAGNDHLDVEALSIGFIGLLEVLWQGFAFQSEADIDRTAARERCMAYLRSIFPGQFDGASVDRSWPAVARTSLDDYRLECDALILASAQLIAHEAALPTPGSVLALDLAGLPVLLVRGARGELNAFVNRCPHSPHELVMPGAHLAPSGIFCRAHGLAWDLAGDRIGTASGAALTPLRVRRLRGFVVALPAEEAPTALVDLLTVQPELVPTTARIEHAVDADWKTVVEHWLDVWLAGEATPRLGAATAPPAVDLQPRGVRVDWRVDMADAARPWTLARFARLSAAAGEAQWSRHFVAPNTLIERHAGGLGVMTVMPVSAGRCRIAYANYGQRHAERVHDALSYLAVRLARAALGEDRAIVESLQRYKASARPAAKAPANASVAAFREYVGRAMGRSATG